ncbi:aminotransferase class IV [Halpernia frigidisoli]|uniref:Branched-chain amino acid aminotransferase n=1 Tax=Halpernia frigidisoli TaxID=1125876 RepID=A0A1I3FS29_9FLAO|nr:aminotransferase class IV [Halpernia frigidisoli]SFI13721.1 branched-chain amino acid aminotransferase [Halpernia frigidisoli]
MSISDLQNRAFLFGDAVWVSFYVRNGALFLEEECYFFLMSSMRKMRMNIPADYTLEYFQNIFQYDFIDNDSQEGIIRMMVYRNSDNENLAKSGVSHYFEFIAKQDILNIEKNIEIDLIKEINVNNNLFSNIYTNSPENIYGEIYAKENDLDDVIFLNPQKRIARSIFGNLLFLSENSVKIPKQTEGAYISPLMEAFVTYLHKSNTLKIEEVEMMAFESQKSEEILIISEAKGIFSVDKIRNRNFENKRFSELLNNWKLSLV